ncbi:MAG: hypothetical protein KF862_26730 [Chitinophagaceae bacterium]|nr:hypothetical protein [Chitinophagaceae bacterium]
MPGRSNKQQALFQYVLIVRKEKPGNIDYISLLLCFTCWIFFVFFGVLTHRTGSAFFWLSFFIPVALFRNWWIKRKRNPYITYKHPLLVTGIVWLFVPGMRWIFILFVLFVLFDHQARQHLEIGVSDDQVVINTFFRKRFQWNELSNVVLKDNLLTLDFKNNKILQREIDPHLSEADEEDFNEFCAEQVLMNEKFEI